MTNLGKVERFFVEVDELELLERYLRVSMETMLSSTEKVAVKIMDAHLGGSLGIPSAVNDRERAALLFLISGWFKESEEKFFGGYPAWESFVANGERNAVDAAIVHIKGILSDTDRVNGWKDRFTEQFGDGYHDGFNEMDGSVEVGYRLQGCFCFPEQLAVSLCHIYYGK